MVKRRDFSALIKLGHDLNKLPREDHPELNVTRVAEKLCIDEVTALCGFYGCRAYGPIELDAIFFENISGDPDAPNMSGHRAKKVDFEDSELDLGPHQDLIIIKRDGVKREKENGLFLHYPDINEEGESALSRSARTYIVFSHHADEVFRTSLEEAKDEAVQKLKRAMEEQQGFLMSQKKSLFANLASAAFGAGNPWALRWQTTLINGFRDKLVEFEYTAGSGLWIRNNIKNSTGTTIDHGRIGAQKRVGEAALRRWYT